MKINSLDFIKSSISEDEKEETIQLLKWIENLKNKFKFKVEKKSLSELKNWEYSEKKTIYNKKKNFFSIEGFSISSSLKNIDNYDQPLIVQDEIGILGFIVKKIDGILYFLVQAKIEPGNINVIQLSPTLQATKSNYQLKHGGGEPDYMHYFFNVSKENLLFDVLLSEEGTRFLKKRNRNMIVYVDDDIQLKDNFKWMTLRQLKSLMQFDNKVNRCARSVISLINYNLNNISNNKSAKKEIEKLKFEKISIFLNSLTGIYKSKNSIENIIQTLMNYRADNTTKSKKIDLDLMRNWETNADEIISIYKEDFSIIGIEANISIREIHSWDQPMIKPNKQAIFGIISKLFKNNIHFLVKIDGEPGTFDSVELSPTVKVFNNSEIKYNPYFDFILKSEKKDRLIDSLQSEEGGRFYKEQNRNILVLAKEDFNEDILPGYMWIDLYQLSFLNQFNNMLNIHLRNFLALIPNHK